MNSCLQTIILYLDSNVMATIVAQDQFHGKSDKQFVKLNPTDKITKQRTNKHR